MKLFVNEPMDQTPFDKARVWCRKHPKISFVSIEALFVLIAVICFHGYLLAGRVQWSSDSIFHWQRIVEIAQSIKHGVWPQFNTFTQYRGSAVMTCYPWLTWLPLALLRILNVPSVLIICGYPIITMVFGLNIGYYAFHTYDHSRMWALIYTLLYNVTFIFTSAWIVQGEYAQTLSYSLAPLAFFGWLHWLKDGHYKMMVIGLSLMLYTHLISTIILVVGLVMLTALCYSRVTWPKVVQGFKAVGTFLLLTAIQWVPIIMLMATNHIWNPELKGPMAINADLIPYSVSAFSGGIQSLYDVPVIIAIFIGIFRWRQIGYYCRRFYIVMMVVLLCNAPFLPWNTIQQTFIRVIQFPYRLDIIIRLCALVITVKGLKLHFDEPNKDRISRVLCVIWTIGIVCFLSAGIQDISLRISKPVHMSLTNIWGVPERIHKLPRAKQQAIFAKARKRMKTKHHLQTANFIQLKINKGYPVITNQQLNSTNLLNFDGQLDYIPKTYIKNANKDQFKKRLAIKGKWHQNGVLHFRVGRNYKRIRLPLVVYHSQAYQYQINHHRVHLQASKNEPIVKNIHKGSYTFQYRTPLMWYRWASFLVALIGFTLLFDIHWRRETK